MKKRIWLLCVIYVFSLIFGGSRVYAFTEEEDAYIQEAREALQTLLQEQPVMALIYLTDHYTVRSAPDAASAEVITVPSGQQVMIQDIVLTQEYEPWAQVQLYSQDVEYTGYVERYYLACSDERFLEWEMLTGMNPRSMLMTAEEGAAAANGVSSFPESYQGALAALAQTHPNWIFVRQDTNLDWATVVANEMGARSLIPVSFPAYMQNGLYSKNWAYASEDTLKYYLDPRNWLTESGIFMFEQLTYNASYQTQDGVQNFLNGSFMQGNLPDEAVTFAEIFQQTGSALNVSPIHLACRVYQEQGKNGTSPLISGTYPGYEGYYNYFNIGASGSTNEQVYTTGLQKAKENGWNSARASLTGGADFISNKYIRRGQDTLYLQKFDVDSSYDGLFWHQYMQNICAPSSEGSNIRKLYAEAGALDNVFMFRIPVYNNMPASACAKPTQSFDIVLTPPAGYTDPHVYLDGVSYDAVIRDGNYVITAPDGSARTAIMYQYNESNVPTGMNVWQLDYDQTGYRITELPELRDLLTYHGFSIRITGRSGIRYKTGIAVSNRQKLLGGGISGYTLKEYGTLIMNNANRGVYPMVLGGQKVSKGVSYGLDSNGQHVDTIYEKVDDRYRYTAVLVGLPVEQYKTEFAFRGYMTLTRDGQDITLYGPIVARSIYALSRQLLDMGMYPEGSETANFLQQLVNDADALGQT
ncbi:MAG: hypothetical protein NC543_04740 [bacterium]|nr:hypothetical protein [bacterium]MCM1374845.1 hypothetical protein [Muribaculum sp.]